MRLRLSGISKRFGALQALADVELELRGGEIHALLGENGAGKSTLMNVLYGLIQPDSGEICIDDRVVRPRDPAEARALGIGMVHQHFTVVAALTTAENFALSLADAGLRFRPQEAAAKATELAARFGLDIGDPFAVSGTLSVGARQRLEILKALTGEARILVLDEPTAVLTPAEVAQLFEVLRALRAEGRLVLLITHKLPEVRQIADRVSVLRRGRIVGGGTPAELSDADLVGLMIGEHPTGVAPVGPAVPAVSGFHPARSADRESDTAGTVGPTRTTAEQIALRLDGLTLISGAPPIDLTLRFGELVGIIGVDGNGQDELFEIVAGLHAPERGRVAIGGTVIEQFTPASVQDAGVGVIPPDRRSDGLVADMTVRENLILSRKLLAQFSRRGVLDKLGIAEFARLQAQLYKVRATALEAKAGTLSGGNQQRIVVARALAGAPHVLLAVNPTRGLDIAAAAAVYEALNAFVAAGNAVLLMTTDLDEVMELSNRIGVLFRHGLSPLLEPPFALEQIGLLMAGGSAGA